MVSMKKVQARFFETASGAKPVREWLVALNTVDRVTIGKDIQRVEFGWPIGMPYCRALGRGLWEVRSDLIDGRIARTIFFFERGEIVLLHGFIKKSLKTPASEIDLAIRRMKELK
jgi:phage-related protein